MTEIRLLKNSKKQKKFYYKIAKRLKQPNADTILLHSYDEMFTDKKLAQVVNHAKWTGLGNYKTRTPWGLSEESRQSFKEH